jgi:hypothetical protein
MNYEAWLVYVAGGLGSRGSGDLRTTNCELRRCQPKGGRFNPRPLFLSFLLFSIEQRLGHTYCQHTHTRTVLSYDVARTHLHGKSLNNILLVAHRAYTSSAYLSACLLPVVSSIRTEVFTACLPDFRCVLSTRGSAADPRSSKWIFTADHSFSLTRVSTGDLPYILKWSLVYPAFGKHPFTRKPVLDPGDCVHRH